MAAWRALTPEQRQAYADAVNILKFQLHGMNLFVTCHMRHDWRDADEAARLTGLHLEHP
jgi:hypothetical protein